MLEESRRQNGKRAIRDEEIYLINHFLKKWNHQIKKPRAGALLVVDQEDGGMGSIWLSGGNGSSIALDLDAYYTDVDGVDVLIRLSLDSQQNPVELDIWKVDFSPLKRYPTPDLVYFS